MLAGRSGIPDSVLEMQETWHRCLFLGESGFSTYYHGRQHLKGLRKRSKGSVLDEYEKEHHQGVRMEMSDFTMKIVENYRRPVLHLSREGLQISTTLRDMRDRKRRIILLKSKAQFYQSAVVRSTFSQGLN